MQLGPVIKSDMAKYLDFGMTSMEHLFNQECYQPDARVNDVKEMEEREAARKKKSPMYQRFMPIHDWATKVATAATSQLKSTATNKIPQNNGQRNLSAPPQTTMTLGDDPRNSPELPRPWSPTPLSSCEDGFPNNERALLHSNVNIEGNIGCGKSTFLKLLQEKIDILDLPEPVQEWTNSSGLNLLYHYYIKPEKWCFMFQTKVIASLMANHHPTQSGILHDLCRAAKTPLTRNDLTIYLRTSPEVCNERIKNRGRPEEATLNQAYIQLIHELHEDWLGGHGSDNIIVLNGNGSPEHALQELEMELRERKRGRFDFTV